MNRGVAYIVFSNWRTGDSGLDTFLRHMEPLFRKGRIAGELVEIPYSEDACRRPDGATATGPPAAAVGGTAGKPSAGRLWLSYMRRLMHDVRLLWCERAKLRNRVCVTNHFGCETLPIALRVLAPRATIVAVCHTHPSQIVRGGDQVRRSVEKICYHCASHVIYNSSAVREEWRQRLGRKHIKGDVIWYGIDPPERALPADYPEKPAGAVDFVCVSRFVPWKGQKELIRAFARAREREKDGEHRTSNIEHRTSNIEHRTLNGQREKVSGVGCQVTGDGGEVSGSPLLRLILVGHGPTWRDCIRYARELGLDPFVTDAPDIRADSAPTASTTVLSGNRSAQNSPAITSPNPESPIVSRHSALFFLGRRPAGAAYFNGADVGVQLSTEPEAFGIVLLEAMSRGKPVIASRIGGMPEVIGDVQCGVLVDPSDTDSVAAAMRDLALRCDARQAMGAAGLKRWRERFTVERMQDEYAAYLTMPGLR